MERNFTNENFEQFLKQNADGLRMLPSEKVWKGISKHFQKRRRRLGFLIGFGLLITTTAGYYLVVKPGNGPDNSAVQAEIAKPKTQMPFIKNTPAGTVENNDNSEVRLNTVPNPKIAIASTANYISLTNPGNNDIALYSTGTDAEKNQDDNNFKGTIVDDSYPLTNQQPLAKYLSSHQTLADPLSIESVMNSYARRKKKLETQIYFTPTVSYRKLSENKAYLKTVSPANIPSSQMNLYDINNFVTHKPDFGFELGLTAKYPVTKNLKVKAGLQFNVNRYDIKVFHSSTQLATIRLNNRNGMDSVNRITNYSNTPSGYSSNWLENFYFQVSAPVGVEFKIKGDDKVEFGLASTVQPTYVLGDRAYLISTDYKNYAEVPWLIRRWNVNTSLETFVSYSTGNLKWQVGPQVRYQLLSSFVKKYPVKENLFDFGLRVGIGLNKQ